MDGTMVYRPTVTEEALDVQSLILSELTNNHEMEEESVNSCNGVNQVDDEIAREISLLLHEEANQNQFVNKAFRTETPT